MLEHHSLPLPDLLARLGVDPRLGLPSREAAERLARQGPNVLATRSDKGPWRILKSQLTGVLVLVLLAAAAASFWVGDGGDAIAILVIVVLNAALGFHQEYRAERAVAALRRLAVPHARVVRDDREQEVPSPLLVPGDILLLEAGNAVPADARLLSGVALQVEEAALTGESQPVAKDPDATFPPGAEVPLGDRANQVHRGTLVVAGHGRAVVTATGMDTELGHIATLIETVQRDPSPLSRRLDRLGRRIALVALVLVAVIFIAGIARGEPVEAMLLLAISLAVAAVPEGLPAVVTIALALGAQRMLERKALIRKLPAVEALGSVTVICSDKTGTLTENRMTVARLAVAGRVTDRTEDQGTGAGGTTGSSEQALLAAAALCCDAHAVAGERATTGDPTEIALVEAAAAAGVPKDRLEATLPRVAEIPFDSQRKRMTTAHRLPPTLEDLPAGLAALGPRFQGARAVAFTKGGVEGVLDRCTAAWSEDGPPQPLTKDRRERIALAHDRLAGEGMRVLAVAFRPLEQTPGSGEGDAATMESDLLFLGLVGLIDPPRAEAAAAVATCRGAGIRPIMITGDHPLTATAIARQVGILQEGEPLVDGVALDGLSEEALGKVVRRTSLYARVAPEHKLRLIEALQGQGEVVAMTGDGVNDAPALKRADIGVAMGKVGTDVAKEAADMVLRDDNFATLVAAVREGRMIYDNIRKFVKFLLASNSGEIWVMLLGPLCGLPLPLLPLQILWMNLVTDGLPALALGVEPAEEDVMRRPPRPPAEGILGRGLAGEVLGLGFLLGVLSLALGGVFWSAGSPRWQTLLFTTLVFSQLSLALAVRSERASFFRQGLFSNPALLGAVLLSALLHLAVVYAPPLQGFFNTVALPPGELAVTLAVSTLPFWALEGWKMGKRRTKGQ